MQHNDEPGTGAGHPRLLSDIVPQWRTAFAAGSLHARFEHKRRFASHLQAVPAWVITAPTPALLGADRALTLGLA